MDIIVSSLWMIHETILTQEGCHPCHMRHMHGICHTCQTCHTYHTWYIWYATSYQTSPVSMNISNVCHTHQTYLTCQCVSVMSYICIYITMYIHDFILKTLGWGKPCWPGNPTCGRVVLSNENTGHSRVAPYIGRYCKVVNITILQRQHTDSVGFPIRAINGGLS